MELEALRLHPFALGHESNIAGNFCMPGRTAQKNRPSESKARRNFMRIRPATRLFLARLFFVCLGMNATIIAASATTPAVDNKNQNNEPVARQNLIREIRHQLLLVPFYSVFDNLSYRIDGDTVTLEGQVVRPTLKSDAEAAVKSVEGVSRVVYKIEVLPLSPMDDQIRRAAYRAIYADTVLSKYAYSSVASIHIIVKNGHVTLVGVVDSEADKNLANIRANSVPDVFSVDNDLTVAAATK